MDEETQNQLVEMLNRIAELEQRVAVLETNGSRTSPVGASSSGEASSVTSDTLMEGIRTALGQLGEGDAGTLRQQLVKNGLPSSLTRSDINKALYAHKDIFTVARQEGMKPVWKLA